MSVSRAGFVLAGGSSARMGRDKALLAVGRTTLQEVVAARVSAAAGSVIAIGPPERYGFLGLRVPADLISACGPLAGVYLCRISPANARWRSVSNRMSIIEKARSAEL